eukprot:TRINITY_DN464_c0_g1_i8.p1 TRINITY_DN464_c0_g1~~TRINITY_DN464_c0_g1_i8.p1  ORF type:complete len:222 (+),score=3.35 TRINITY_DN464_c0_g1_i8:638-1303(+)
MTKRLYDSPPLNGVFPQLMFLQNLPSVLVSHILDPLPGERVIDMCAAPGGKTTHIATLMQDKGTVIALDRNAGKVACIVAAAKRWGLTCIEAHVQDATVCVVQAEDTLDEQSRSNSTGSIVFESGSFDRVLLDPPCSALGLRPKLKDMSSGKNVSAQSKYQKSLMRSAFRLLKVGGTLVYSTCTINPQENEMMVRYALDTFSVKLEPAVSAGGRIGEVQMR